MKQAQANSVKRRPRVFGTGLVALDLVVSRHREGRTQQYAGGTCGNVLTILSFFGWDAYPISRLNGDFTSRWVREDLERWGVHTDYMSLEPTGPAPVIIEWINEDKQGRRSHRYSFVCPTCGSRKPAHKPVLASAAKQLVPKIHEPDVFFFDRVSRASVLLARHSRENGAVIFFEPSGVGEPKLFREALSLAHILKYSSDRMGDVMPGYPRKRVLLEIETKGAAGLRFRSRLSSYKTTGWEHLDALPVPKLKDAAGAGDWLTAMLLDRIARPRSAGFEQTTKKTLLDALRIGQAAAAWNCGFEAPRGGMYCCSDAASFAAEVQTISSGKRPTVVAANDVTPREKDSPLNVACLKCHVEPIRSNAST